jgi:hypothetical protein
MSQSVVMVYSTPWLAQNKHHILVWIQPERENHQLLMLRFVHKAIVLKYNKPMFFRSVI